MKSLLPIDHPGIIAIIALALGVCIGGLFGALFLKETIVVREGTADTEAAMSSVDLMIDYGNGVVKTWNTVSWHEAMSIVNLLETVAGAKGITLLTKDGGDKNITVTTIDDIANDAEKNMRWQYWINNTYEPRIASKYFLKPGDIVLWKMVAEQPK